MQPGGSEYMDTKRKVEVPKNLMELYHIRAHGRNIPKIFQ
jgi:hypothetical protein